MLNDVEADMLDVGAFVHTRLVLEVRFRLQAGPTFEQVVLAATTAA